MRLLCLDFGGSAIKYGLLDTGNQKLTEKGSIRNTFTGREDLLEAVFTLAAQMKPYEGIAVSYCGELDHWSGYIYSPGTYLYNRDLPMKEVLEERLHVPVSVENDGNCAMLAEWKYGSLQGYDDACMIVLGTGIAGSLVLDGQLHTGKRGFAGIFSLFQTNLEKSGGIGNLAFSAAASAFLPREYLIRTGRPLPADLWFGQMELDGEGFDGRKFFELFEAGDPIAAQVLDQYASNVCNLLFNVLVTTEVEAFSIGGGISSQKILIDKIREKMDDVFSNPLIGSIQLPKPRIEAAGFGNDANLVGAAEWFLTLYKERLKAQ